MEPTPWKPRWAEVTSIIAALVTGVMFLPSGIGALVRDLQDEGGWLDGLGVLIGTVYLVIAGTTVTGTVLFHLRGRRLWFWIGMVPAIVAFSWLWWVGWRPWKDGLLGW